MAYHHRSSMMQLEMIPRAYVLRLKLYYLSIYMAAQHP